MPRNCEVIELFVLEIERTLHALRRKQRLELEQEQTVAMADNQNQRVLLDYVVPNVNGARPSIVRPTVNANNFEIKPGLI